MAADIPLPASPSTSSPNPTFQLSPHPDPPPEPSPNSKHPSPVTTASNQLPIAPDPSIDRISTALLPILLGEQGLLGLHQALLKIYTHPDPSIPTPTSSLLALLNERHDQLDRLRLCDPEKLVRDSSSDPALQPPEPPDAPPDTSGPLAAELGQVQAKLKQEEEKRAKSISLLRAVRQKLVQTEKEKAALEATYNALKADSTAQIEGLQRDRARLEEEQSRLKISQDQQLSKLRHGYEREAQLSRVQYEREAAARRSQAELDAITAKAAHERELAARAQRVAQLEGELRDLAADRERLFGQLQTRQAALEGALAQSDEAKGAAGELQHELGAAQDRIHALVEELDHLRKLHASQDRDDRGLERLLAETEAQHAARVTALASRVAQLEKERTDVETELGQTLQERLREIERMRADAHLKSLEYADSLRNMNQRNEEIERGERTIKVLREELDDIRQARETESQEASQLKQELEELTGSMEVHTARLGALEAELSDSKQREGELKQQAQSLRDELRKVHDSGLLSLANESRRDKGIGFFASFSTDSRDGSLDSSGTAGPGPSGNGSGEGGSNLEAEVNFEYLRNTLLQFLEHKEMRPHLVRVLGVILHFTPQETRRLAAKV